MREINLTLLLGIVVVLSGCARVIKVGAAPRQDQRWRAIHVSGYANDDDLETLGKSISHLAETGLNVLILEVDYDFDFKSHPELRRGDKPITKTAARRLVGLCRKHGVRLIPQFQCLGHQSWRRETFPLLAQYPEFDLTPGKFPNNEGIYCREWYPLNPRVNEIIFELMDELIDAFEADAMHVGMDEVFLLGSEHSPATKGKDPAQLFAKAVNDYYGHIVKTRGVEMLMWGDRLIDGKRIKYGEWESSLNGTADAVDMIPRDIIICDWHYGRRRAYRSVPMFLEKGFRVLPASWKRLDATIALIGYAKQQENSRMLGHLFTTWSVKKDQLTEFSPVVEGLKLLRNGQCDTDKG